MGRPVWREAGHEYVRCAACHTFFANLTKATYETGRHNAWDEANTTADVTGFYGDARRVAHAAFLERMPPTGTGRLLDVGCGLGYFLERAGAAGWDVAGVEPSAAWANVAAERIGPQRVLAGTADDPALDGQRFDLITAWDVIEHVFDPLPFLSRLARLLADGGRLFLRTPNLDYVLPVYRLRRRAGHDVELGPLNHVVYFTARTLAAALDRVGLDRRHWLALPPPQVSTFSANGLRYDGGSTVVRLKNAWAAAADVVASATQGRVAAASDLDVLASATSRSQT